MNFIFDFKIKNKSLTWWITLFLSFKDNFIITHLHNLNLKWVKCTIDPGGASKHEIKPLVA